MKTQYRCGLATIAILMNRPIGQQCLAKAMSMIRLFKNTYPGSGNYRHPGDVRQEMHAHTDGRINRQYAILCLVRFTEPLPDNKLSPLSLYRYNRSTFFTSSDVTILRLKSLILNSRFSC